MSDNVKLIGQKEARDERHTTLAMCPFDGF